MFNFNIERRTDDLGEWYVVATDAVAYYVAWYPDHRETLRCTSWSAYGF